MPVTSGYPPYYGSSTPFTQPQANPSIEPIIPTGRGDWVQSAYGLGGLGQVVASNDWLYAGATVVGAGIGGGLIGYVAAKKQMDGVKRGAAFSGGLTAVVNGFSGWKANGALLSATLVGGGLAGMWWAIKQL